MIEILKLLFLTAVHLILVGLDVICFFLVIRVLSIRWPKAALLAFNRVGAPLVDPLMATAEKVIPRAGSALDIQARIGRALVLLACVEVMRMAVTAMAKVTVHATGGEITVWLI